jgi:hypothetical protein
MRKKREQQAADGILGVVVSPGAVARLRKAIYELAGQSPLL